MPTNRIKITAFNNKERNRDTLSIDTAKDYQIDYKAWAEEYGNVTSVTYEVISNNATVSNESLSSNLASFLLTCSQAGRVLLKVTATTGTYTNVSWLDVFVRDPSSNYVNDYGF